jgi:ElaB/YqjD/DUF883 family membrane-anchored ribosome-binding protein
MDKESDLMNQEPDEIRGQIEETRSALTEKLETLEHGVKETVSEAKAAVTDTIENVKDTVKGTVETVKETLDIRCYVREYPWPMLAGSVAVGWALGCVFPRLTNGGKITHMASGDKITHIASNGTPLELNNRPGTTPEPKVAPREKHQGALSLLYEKFRPEIQELEGVAIGAIGALVRDLVKQSASEPLAERFGEVADRVTAKLGGRVMDKPLFAHSNRD